MFTKLGMAALLGTVLLSGMAGTASAHERELRGEQMRGAARDCDERGAMRDGDERFMNGRDERFMNGRDERFVERDREGRMMARDRDERFVERDREGRMVARGRDDRFRSRDERFERRGFEGLRLERSGRR